MLKGKLPSEVVNERHQYVNGLKQFVEEQKQKLKQVLQQLGLTEESLGKVEPKQLCPYDSNHYVPEKSFKKHIEKCRLLKAGYQKNELPSQLANTDFCYEGKSSLKIELDESLLNKVIWDDCVQKGEVYTGHRTLPASHMEESINLTQNDRLAIYRHVVEKSHEAGKVMSVDKSDELLTTDWGSLVKKGLLDAQNNEQYSSKLEQLAALRDLKRRRQSYRAKNVHITKKSYTEIIREVIVNQMQVLVPAHSKRHIEEVPGDEDKYKSRSERDKDRNRRDRDRDRDYDDRSSNYNYSHRKRSRSRDRDRKRRRYHDERDGWKEEKEEEDRDREEGRRRSRHEKAAYDLQSECEYPKTGDLECVKEEPIMSADRVGSGSRNESGDYNYDMSSPSRNRSSASSPSRRSRRSRSRSRSYSSSQGQSSDEDQHHRSHSRHKKSKHKKKSKHSKKHSKKHKR